MPLRIRPGQNQAYVASAENSLVINTGKCFALWFLAEGSEGQKASEFLKNTRVKFLEEMVNEHHTQRMKDLLKRQLDEVRSTVSFLQRAEINHEKNFQRFKKRNVERIAQAEAKKEAAKN